MDRIIKVTGKGKISVKPDTIKIDITQESVEKTYEKAIAKSAEEKNKLSGSLSNLGFAEDALKTAYFSIDTNEERYQEMITKIWKTKVVGYKYVHKMILEFPLDNDILGKVLFLLMHCSGKPEFRISYTVADPDSVKDELLQRAISDSRHKAEVLAASSGVTLGNIQTIDYSWDQIDIINKNVGYGSYDYEEGDFGEYDPPIGAGTIDIGIAADDIDVTDTVTVVWEII